MTRRRPAPRGNRPAPDATNVSASVEPDAGLFGLVNGPYGSVSFTEVQTSHPALSGPQRRDQGIRRAVQADVGWLGDAHRVIVELAAAGEAFSAEDLRARTEPPEPNLVGVAIRRARLLGLIVPAGTDTANRPAAHGRLLRLWRGRRPGA